MRRYRPDTTELGDARRRVEALLEELPDGVGERGFDHPWQLRAFALAVAAYHNGQYEWSEFQLSLIRSINRWERESADEPDHASPWQYYEHWLNALEEVLAGHGLLSGVALDDRTAAVLATPRSANHHAAHRDPVAIDPAR